MLRREGKLVALPELASMHADSRLPANRRYCRVWTGHFLTDLARVHYERFHKPLQINSAVRTIEYQRHLLHINGNAAPAEGDVASPHLTGEAVDIAKKGLTPSEVAWMRAYLLPLQTAGKIDVEEEFQQSCFHISVYRSYMAPRPEATPLPASLALWPPAFADPTSHTPFLTSRIADASGMIDSIGAPFSGWRAQHACEVRNWKCHG